MAVPFPLHAHLEFEASGNQCFFCPKDRVLCNDSTQEFHIQRNGSHFRAGKSEKEENTRAWNRLKESVERDSSANFSQLVKDVAGYSEKDIERGRSLRPRHYEQIVQQAAPAHPSSNGGKRTAKTLQLDIHKEPDGTVDASYMQTIERVNTNSPRTPTHTSRIALEMMEHVLE